MYSLFVRCLCGFKSAFSLCQPGFNNLQRLGSLVYKWWCLSFNCLEQNMQPTEFSSTGSNTMNPVCPVLYGCWWVPHEGVREKLILFGLLSFCERMSSFHCDLKGDILAQVRSKNTWAYVFNQSRSNNNCGFTPLCGDVEFIKRFGNP